MVKYLKEDITMLSYKPPCGYKSTLELMARKVVTLLLSLSYQMNKSSECQLFSYTPVITTCKFPRCLKLRNINPSEYLMYGPWERWKSFSVDPVFVLNVAIDYQEGDLTDLCIYYP
jgi:hypothetical protein